MREDKTRLGLSFSNKMEIHDLAVSPDDRYLAMAYGGVWADMGPSKIIGGKIKCVYLFDRKAYEQSLDGNVPASPDPTRLTTLGSNRLAIGYGRKIKVWDMPAQKFVSEFDGPDKLRTWLGSPDGWYLACVTNDNKIYLYVSEIGKSQTLAGHTAPITALVFSRDHLTLFSADKSGKVIAWNTQSGTRETTLNMNNKPVQGITLVNNDSELLAAVPGSLLRWRRDAPKTVHAITTAHPQFGNSGVVGSGWRPDFGLGDRCG